MATWLNWQVSWQKKRHAGVVWVRPVEQLLLIFGVELHDRLDAIKELRDTVQLQSVVDHGISLLVLHDAGSFSDHPSAQLWYSMALRGTVCVFP